MALQKREKILVWIVAALIAVVALPLAASMLRGPSGNLSQQLDTARAEYDRQQNRLAAAGRATALLELRRSQSLPENVETAQGLYDTWLRKLATDAGFSDKAITYLNTKAVAGVFSSLRFRIRAKTTSKGLTEFLYRFYEAPFLQKITLITITPDDQGTSLGVQMTIEALALQGAAAKDKLPEGKSDRKFESIDVYQKKIADRNVFGIYVEPPRERPQARPSQPPKSVDPLEFTELNSIVADNGRWQIWLNAKMDGERYKLFEGEEVEIGPSKCKVLRIGRRDADIEIDGKQFRISLGQSLRSGVPLNEKP